MEIQGAGAMQDRGSEEGLKESSLMNYWWKIPNISVWNEESYEDEKVVLECNRKTLTKYLGFPFVKT